MPCSLHQGLGSSRAAVDLIPRPCPSCRRRVFPCWVASACSGSLLGCLRGAWWVVRTSQRTLRTGNDLMNRFLATPGEELEVTRWRWASAYALMCCSQNCIQGMFFRVHGEICNEDLTAGH